MPSDDSSPESLVASGVGRIASDASAIKSLMVLKVLLHVELRGGRTEKVIQTLDS